MRNRLISNDTHYSPHLRILSVVTIFALLAFLVWARQNILELDTAKNTSVHKPYFKEIKGMKLWRVEANRKYYLEAQYAIAKNITDPLTTRYTSVEIQSGNINGKFSAVQGIYDESLKLILIGRSLGPYKTPQLTNEYPITLSMKDNTIQTSGLSAHID